MTKSEKSSRYERLGSRAQHTHAKVVEGATGCPSYSSGYAICIPTFP